jgi:hypothetical protein
MPRSSGGAKRIGMSEIHKPNPICKCTHKIYFLHRGRLRRPIVKVVPFGRLFKIHWPDGEISDHINLTRAKAAALEWAQQKAVTEDRKSSVARRLKSLDNFWWSSSPVAQNDRTAA